MYVFHFISTFLIILPNTGEAFWVRIWVRICLIPKLGEISLHICFVFIFVCFALLLSGWFHECGVSSIKTLCLIFFVQIFFLGLFALQSRRITFPSNSILGNVFAINASNKLRHFDNYYYFLFLRSLFYFCTLSFFDEKIDLLLQYVWNQHEDICLNIIKLHLLLSALILSYWGYSLTIECGTIFSSSWFCSGSIVAVCLHFHQWCYSPITLLEALLVFTLVWLQKPPA